MIVIRLPQKDGTVLLHTFYSAGSAMQSCDDEIDFWKTWIHDAAGYTVDPDAPKGVSIISLPRVEWKKIMVERHADDCIDAVRKLAVRFGISLKKSKPVGAERAQPKSKSKPKNVGAEHAQPKPKIEPAEDSQPEQ